MWRSRRNRNRQRAADLERASGEAAASLATARADHERERRDAGHDTRLIESLRRIRAENHFADVVAAAFHKPESP